MNGKRNKQSPYRTSAPPPEAKRLEVWVDDPMLPMVVLSDVEAASHTHDFVHLYDRTFDDHYRVRGVGMRLEDNLECMPEIAERLVLTLKEPGAGDDWYALRRRMGDEALIRWRLGAGKPVEELLDLCATVDVTVAVWQRPEPLSVEAARHWRDVLAATLGAFPAVGYARAGAVVSEPFDPMPIFADWRVVTFATDASPLKFYDPDGAEAGGITAGPRVSDAFQTSSRARAHFLWSF